MSNPLLQKNYGAAEAIGAYRIVKLASNTTVTRATAATDSIVGVVNEVGPAINERCDVIVAGIAFVEAGAAVTRGTLITADSVGRGVTAAPSAGTNNRILGIALEDASAAGDIIHVMVNPGSTQG